MFPVLYNIHLQIIYFVPSFHKYALSTCNMPGPVVQDAGKSKMNLTADSNLAVQEFTA